METTKIPLATCVESSYQNRKELGDVSGLARSIEVNGQITPLIVVVLALPQNQPNAPLYPAGGAPGSRPGALPHFGRPRYLGPPPRARSTAG